jgi:hypothetical protein
MTVQKTVASLTERLAKKFEISCNAGCKCEINDLQANSSNAVNLLGIPKEDILQF